MFGEQAFLVTGGHGAVAEGRYHGPVSDTTRYRCTSCGNLTRFDVTSTRRTASFHHYTVGGELSVEDVRVIDEQIESVECRWCGAAGKVEAIESAGKPAAEG